MTPHRLSLTVTGARVELLPVFVECSGRPAFAGYRLNVIQAPGAGLVSLDDLDRLAELFTAAAEGARSATR